MHTHSHTHTEERRLFVGMLNKNFTEDDVRVMFSPYGGVEDVSILRNADGRSKGVHVCLSVCMLQQSVCLSVCLFGHVLPLWRCGGCVHIMKYADGRSKGTRLYVASFNTCRSVRMFHHSTHVCPFVHVCCSIQHMSVRSYMYVAAFNTCLSVHMLHHSTHVCPSVCCSSLSVRLYVAAVCLSSSICPSGTAFVRLSSRAQALQAITALHQSQTMPVSRVHVCVCVCVCVVCVCECVC